MGQEYTGGGVGVGLTAILPIRSWVNVQYIYSSPMLKYTELCMWLESGNAHVYLHLCVLRCAGSFSGVCF